MNIAAHNPKFLNGLSIARLLSRIAILTSQFDGAKKQITTMTSQIMDLTSQNTAYLQRINELERSATLDSNNSCKPPSSDGLRKPNGKKRQRQERLRTRKSGQIVYAKNPAVSPGVNRATKAILSSRLPTRTRLLISCRSNVRIVRPSSHLKIQLVVSTDRFLIVTTQVPWPRSTGVDILFLSTTYQSISQFSNKCSNCSSTIQ